jgi:hypothetical protein
MTTSIIKKADAATDVVIDNWHKAADALAGGVDYNGLGILYDPSRTLSKMITARDALDAAIATHRATKWPTNADYDENEVAS